MQVSEKLIEKLKSRVQFDTDADITQFLVDAINSYVALGKYISAGSTLQLQMSDGGTRNIVLPLQSQGGAAKAVSAEACSPEKSNVCDVE